MLDCTLLPVLVCAFVEENIQKCLTDSSQVSRVIVIGYHGISQVYRNDEKKR